MVSIGSYRLFLDCVGGPSATTVVFLSGTGVTSGTWKKVQPEVAPFARACRYDREGEGKSDIHIPLKQTFRDIVSDLHTVLANAGIPPPYVLVGHSMGGIYARKFQEEYPNDVAGLVFVDSADEEQVWRYESISHSLLFEYKEWPNYSKLAQIGFMPPGALLNWHANVPLFVLEHGITWPRGFFKGLTEDEYAELKTTWDHMQRDLASRSPCSQFEIAEKSGHFIQEEQPELVTQAIQRVLGMPCAH